jgi:hypothetical protein
MPEVPIILFTLYASEATRSKVAEFMDAIVAKNDPNLMAYVRSLALV